MILNLEKLIKKYNMNIRGIYHIGANKGQEIPEYERLGIDNVILFEPNPRCVSIVEEKIQGKINYEVHRCALGESDVDEITLFDSSNGSASASILKPKEHIERHPHVKFEGFFKAPMKRLDSFMKNGYNFINIDVQGYEMNVFRGGETILKNVDYIMTEINYSELYENCTLAKDLIPYLSKFGFKMVEEHKTKGNWGDAFFVKK